MMKNLLWLAYVGFVCLALVTSAAVHAQEAALHPPQPNHRFFGPVPDRQLQATDDSGYQRYETPRELVSRNAAMKAAQRRERMAINARFGYSPSRPPASTMPSMSSPLVPPTAFRLFTPYPGSPFPRPYSRYW